MSIDNQFNYYFVKVLSDIELAQSMQETADKEKKETNVPYRYIYLFLVFNLFISRIQLFYILKF